MVLWEFGERVGYSDHNQCCMFFWIAQNYVTHAVDVEVLLALSLTKDVSFQRLCHEPRVLIRWNWFKSATE